MPTKIILRGAQRRIRLEKKKSKDDERKVFPIVADMMGVWEEIAEEDDVSDILGSYTGNPYRDFYPEQDADDL